MRGDALAALTRVPFAHRGLHDDRIPENSLGSIEAAIRAGLGVEIDVRLALDGVVLHHDATLADPPGVPVRAVPVDHLAGLGIASLAEALALVDGAVPVLVDMKTSTDPRRTHRLVAAVADHLRGYPGPAALTTFDPLAVTIASRLLPQVPRGQSAGVVRQSCWRPTVTVPLLRPVDQYWTSPLSRPQFLSHNVHRLPSRAVRRHRLAGGTVLGWTVRTATELAQAAAEVDNVIVEGEAARLVTGALT